MVEYEPLVDYNEDTLIKDDIFVQVESANRNVEGIDNY